MRWALVAVVLAWPFAAPAEAHTPTVSPDAWLHAWQAKRVVKWAAREGYRPDFRVETTRRLDARTIRVCWSEPGSGPADILERDYGCDVVQLRGRQWWLKDAALGGSWRRRL